MVTLPRAQPFEAPRQRRRLAGYAEAAWAQLSQQETITRQNLEAVWNQIEGKKQELRFRWQQDTLSRERCRHLRVLLRRYQRAPGRGVYIRKLVDVARDCYT